MSLAGQWREVQRLLPEGWVAARLELTVTDPSRADRAAVLLGPLAAVRRGSRFAFYAGALGDGASPTAVGRALAWLDEEGIEGVLKLVSSGEVPAAIPEDVRTRRVEASQPLAVSWDAQLQGLPPDWSDLYAEIELTSTDYLERGALLMAPLNPSRFDGTPAFRFRAARRFGYGASAGMVRRCLERLDAGVIRGQVRVLWALSDTQPVATQGPVWYVGGRAV